MHEQPRLISLQRSQDLGSKPSQADGKMFLFSSLKLFIKGSLLPQPRLGWLLESALKSDRRLTPRWNSRKRDCGLVYPFLTSTFFFRPPMFPISIVLSSFVSFSRARTKRNPSGGCRGREKKLRQLPADFGIWSTDYVPPRMLIPLSFIERRFRNDTSRFEDSAIPRHRRTHPSPVHSDKSNECVIYEIECFNKPSWLRRLLGNSQDEGTLEWMN